MSQTDLVRLPRVLFVDDDELMRRCLRRSLQKVAEIFAAGSAEEAHAMLRAMPFDVIVSDYALADGDGLALLTSASSLQPAAKRALLSGHEPTAEVRQALARGLLDAALRKPDGLPELVRIVRACTDAPPPGC